MGAKKRICISISEKLSTRLDEKMKETGLDMAELVRAALDRFLGREDY